MLAERARCIDCKPLVNTLYMKMMSAWQLTQFHIVLVLAKANATHCIFW
jgi:hypothetical protein